MGGVGWVGYGYVAGHGGLFCGVVRVTRLNKRKEI